MFSTLKLAAIGAVLAAAASGIAFAQTTPDHHSRELDQQQMMQSGQQHPIGQGEIAELFERMADRVGTRTRAAAD